MLHLYCLIWLYNIFHITQLCNQFQVNSKYAIHIVEFIDYIIKYSIIPKDKVYVLQSNTPLAFFDESDSSFILKLDVDLNVVARKYQIHLSTYTTTCYKYGVTTTGQ